MARHTVLRILSLLVAVAATRAVKEQTRWSRQISTYTADISDWVPLPGPVEREITQTKKQPVAEPRILAEPFPSYTRSSGFNQGAFNQDAFPSRMFLNSPTNRQLYLQSLPAVPSAPQNYLTDQGFGQSIRFGLSQPNFPLNQGFVSQPLTFETIPQLNMKPQQISHNPQVKFETAPKISQPIRPQVQPFITQSPIKPEIPKYFDGYRIQNVSNDFNTKRPQSLQKLKYDGVKTETIPPNKPKVEREEVQLLYVPLESLNSGQFNYRTPIATPQVINSDLYSQIQKQFPPIPPQIHKQIPVNSPPVNKPSADYQKQKIKNVANLNPNQEIFSTYNAKTNTIDQTPKFTTLSTPFPTLPSSTPKPKKLKPHQPPLAIFLTQEARKDHQVKVGDVLFSLKNANTIAVLDAVNPQTAPKVFIGPSSLTPPENYVKFDLPYLSNIENIEKKLRQLPFFVAPLSYKTPQGFAKIPFPSPHVGSVVINSQINKEAPPQIHATTLSDPPPSFYTYNQFPTKQAQNIEPQKSTNYYTTAPPKPKIPSNYEPNYYSFDHQGTRKEPETVSKANSYFLSNIGSQYNANNYVSFPSAPNLQSPEVVQNYPTYQSSTARTIPTQKPTTTTTSTTTTTTTTTTTPKPSTYPSQLLETHNPYSINHAFHFSTPIDYQNFFDEYKENYATPGQAPNSQAQPQVNVSSPSPITNSQETERTQSLIQGPPNYQQGYTPEVHYESEVQSSRYPTHDTNPQTNKQTYYSQTNNPVIQEDSFKPSSDLTPPRIVNEQTPTESVLSPSNPPAYDNPPESTENHIPITNAPFDYSKFDNSFGAGEYEQSTQSSTTTTTTITTRRPPLRTRGRPRYPTTKADTGEYTTKQTSTRRPLRERRPLPSRNRYEPNKITTEKTVKKPTEATETTTKYTRTRTRGRVHYRPSDADDIPGKRSKQSSKENDLAYQRDVLHQNYPVTLMERASTADIDAITEPTFKVSSASTRYSEDTENAYSNDKVTVTEHSFNTENTENLNEYSKDYSAANVLSIRNEENIYQSGTSPAPDNTYATREESKDDDAYSKQTTPIQPTAVEETTVPAATEPAPQVNENHYSPTYKYDSIKEEVEETTTQQNVENDNVQSEGENQQQEQEENVIQTTPSYNRVRVRPGVIRQYHQSSTESSRVRVDRRRPGQAITYRPTFDKRRTTMRIDEIEADLKTKQVHSRPEVQDYRHPVYKPEPTTEPSATTALTQETTKRGLYRRRRPTYTVSSTETSTSKKSYETRNRFRGRRPTEKPTEKPEEQAEVTTTTTRDTPAVRYSERPRFSDRFNRNHEPEEQEDQDPNYSIQRPKYAVPDSNRWSPKISTNSFKPYNPNDVIDEVKVPAVDQQPEGPELDIITAKNEYDNVLISVTPATNNRVNKKIPDIPPTLEALVEQSRLTKTEGTDTMSTFESMLEEVMKSLEEQDEDEYTKNVMKHKGGEIGEIPPEKIISPTTVTQDIVTTTAGTEEAEQITEKEHERKTRRRGFWKKVKVRPATTESFEAAESQYYSNAVNRLGQPVKLSKTGHEKSDKIDKSKLTVTTYKPTFQFIKELFETDNEDMEITPDIEIPKITTVKSNQHKQHNDRHRTTIAYTTKESDDSNYPSELDLGTGSPDSTFGASTYFAAVTEPVITKKDHSAADRSDGFSFMDYLFGVTSPNDDDKKPKKEIQIADNIALNLTTIEQSEQTKTKTTTETTYIPEEFNAVTTNEDVDNISIDKNQDVTNKNNIVRDSTEPLQNHIETTTMSSFMDSLKIVSTSMSTEISHETEICFRGKCIKTNKPML